MALYNEDEELQKAIQASLTTPVRRPSLSKISKYIHLNRSFQACPILKQNMENIGKLVLPHYIIRNDLRAGKSLGSPENPVIFKVFLNNKPDNYIYLGLLEFHNDDSELLYLPYSVLERLGIEVGAIVHLTTIVPNTIPKANYIKIQPIESSFVELSDPRKLIEDNLNQNFTALSENQQLTIKHEQKEYNLFIKELKSETGDYLTHADITNIDLNLEFETSLEELNIQAEKDRQEAEAKAKAETEAAEEAKKAAEEAKKAAKKAAEESKKAAENAESILRDTSQPLTMAEQMAAIRAMRAKQAQAKQAQAKQAQAKQAQAPQAQFPGMGQSISGRVVKNPLSLPKDILSESLSDTESESDSNSR